MPSLPKIPTSFTEVWDNVKSTATSFVSDKEEKSSEKVINDEDNSANIKDPLEIITETRDAALSKSCHCPIGACLGHEVNPPQTDPTLPSS